MIGNEEQVKVVELMAKYEECLAELYRVYAGKFADDAEFWNKLAREEIGHANILRGFSAGLVKGEYISRKAFFTQNVFASIADIQLKIIDAKEKDMTPKQALAVADGLESGMLEHEYFRAVAGDSTRFRSAIVRLIQDTERHRALVKDKLADCG